MPKVNVLFNIFF